MAALSQKEAQNAIKGYKSKGMTDGEIVSALLKRKDKVGDAMRAAERMADQAGEVDSKHEIGKLVGLDTKKTAPSQGKGLVGRSVDKIKDAGKQIVSNNYSDGGFSNLGGLADAALAVPSGMADMAMEGYAGLGGMGRAAVTGKPVLEGYDKGVGNYQKTGASRVLKAGATPRTETGGKLMDVLGIVDDAFVTAGDAAYDSTGSPVVGAGVQTGLNLLSMMLPAGAKGKGRRAPDGPNPTPNAPPRPTTGRPLTREQIRARAEAVRTARQANNPPPVNPQSPPVAPQPQAVPTTGAALSNRSVGAVDSVAAQLDALQNQPLPVTPPQPVVPPTPTATPASGPRVSGVEPLLRLDESRPRVGGVQPEIQGLRAQVLQDIGLADDGVRKGSITGDITQLETEKAMSKLETPEGLKMREQMDVEFERMNDYATRIIEDDIGARAGASPESRGQVVIDALQGYKDWYKEQVAADYKRADEISGGKGGIKLDELQTELARSSSWQGKKENQQLRRGVVSYLNEMELYDAKTGTVKPMTARQAEGLRQYVNSQWSHESAGIIGRINEKIDNGVFKVLDDNAYVDARARYRKYKETFDNPNGIAKILDIDGINSKVSPEQVGRNIQLLAAKDGKQFNHIYGLLDEVPDAIKPQAARAKAEIQAAIAESVLGKGGLKSVNKEWMQYRKTNDEGKHKAEAIFGEETAAKIDNYVAARNVLQHHDPNPSGTATTAQNIDAWNSSENAAGAAAGIGGAIASGGSAIIGVAAGITGKAISRKFKAELTNRQNRVDYDTSINPRRAEVYREAHAKLVGDVIDSAEMKAIIDEFEKPKPNETKLRVLQRKLTVSDAWKAYAKSLPPKAAKAAINNADVLTLLTQGANSYEGDALAPTF